MRTPKIMLAVYCGNERAAWINPRLCGQLVTLPRTGVDIALEFICGLRPLAVARNAAIQKMRDNGCEWLMQIDNDQFLGPHVGELLHAIGNRKVDKRCIILPTLFDAFDVPEYNVQVSAGGTWHYPLDLPQDWFHVDIGGGGCTITHRDVFKAVDDGGPIYRDPIGKGTGEDLEFSERVKAAGIPQWAHGRYISHHLKTVDLETVRAFVQAERRKHDNEMRAFCEANGISYDSPVDRVNRIYGERVEV